MWNQQQQQQQQQHPHLQQLPFYAAAAAAAAEANSSSHHVDDSWPNLPNWNGTHPSSAACLQHIHSFCCSYPHKLTTAQLEEDGMSPYPVVEAEDMMARDGSSLWMDCMMDDLRCSDAQAALLAYCFAGESMHSSSERAGGEPWTEEFDPSAAAHICYSEGATPVLPQPHQFSTSIPSPPQKTGPATETLCKLKAANFLGLSSEKAGEERSNLVELILHCIEAVDQNQISETLKDSLLKLRAAASPTGDSLHRLASYVADGLESRLNASHSPHIHPQHQNLADLMIAYKHFDDACPYLRFTHLTANQAILDFSEAATRIHIIDCSILQGIQWSALLQAFSVLPQGAPKIRITGIASSNLGVHAATSLLATGKRLTEFAELLNLQFEFCPITEKLEDLETTLLTLHENEFLAVNFMLQLTHHSNHDLNCLQRVLKIVQGFKPRVVITAGELDAGMDSISLQASFANFLQFYSAILDSLDATMGIHDPDRLKVETLFFSKEIRSMMAYTGNTQKRIENWRSILKAAAFSNGNLSHYAKSQARLLLWPYVEGFTIIEAPGSLSIAWMGHPIVTVSVWHC